MRTTLIALATALGAGAAFAQELPTVETLGAALSPDTLPKSLMDWAEENNKSMPRAISTRVTPTGNTVRVTETFEFADNVKDVWAAMPAGLALTAAMGGPVTVQQGVKTFGRGPYGPRTYVEGASVITYTISIPQLEDYLFNQPAWTTKSKNSPAYTILRQLLREEIDKVLTLGKGEMAPFEHRSPGTGTRIQWDSPAETIITLSWALPFLERSQADALKEYIKGYYEKYDPLVITSVGQGKGARREYYDVSERKTNPTRGRNMQGLYAVWQYVHSVAGEAKAAEVMPAVRAFLAAEMDSDWDAGESTATFNARGISWSTMNNRINGYIGAARLAHLAGDPQTEQLAQVLLVRAMAVRAGQAHYHQWLIQTDQREGRFRSGAQHPGRGLMHFTPGFFGEPDGWQADLLPLVDGNGLRFTAGFRGTDWAYPFLNELTPELGEFLHDYARTPVNVAIKSVMWRNPGIWLARGNTTYAGSQHEDWVPQPYIGWITFMTLATVTQEEPDELVWYIGDSAARFGDMYYLQRLALALRAYATTARRRD